MFTVTVAAIFFKFTPTPKLPLHPSPRHDHNRVPCVHDLHEVQHPGARVCLAIVVAVLVHAAARADQAVSGHVVGGVGDFPEGLIRVVKLRRYMNKVPVLIELCHHYLDLIHGGDLSTVTLK